MNISISSLVSLAPVFGVVVLAVIVAFLLARGDDAIRTRRSGRGALPGGAARGRRGDRRDYGGAVARGHPAGAGARGPHARELPLRRRRRAGRERGVLPPHHRRDEPRADR